MVYLGDHVAIGQSAGAALVCDWIEARGIYGQPSRRGQIIELLGRGHHRRDRVRWAEKHESFLYPADAVVIVSRRRRARDARG